VARLDIANPAKLRGSWRTARRLSVNVATAFLPAQHDPGVWRLPHAANKIFDVFKTVKTTVKLEEETTQQIWPFLSNSFQ
jgi:hypothetical protein